MNVGHDGLTIIMLLDEEMISARVIKAHVPFTVLDMLDNSLYCLGLSDPRLLSGFAVCFLHTREINYSVRTVTLLIFYQWYVSAGCVLLEKRYQLCGRCLGYVRP